jgi:NitT/TauT family transport system substrate-binding protein
MRLPARLALVALAALALAVPESAFTQPLTSVKVATFAADSSAEVYYALDQGFFKDAGLDVSVTALNNGAAIAAAVASGSYDVGSANMVSLAVAREHGIPFTFVAPAGYYASRSPTNALVVAKGSPLHAARDLDGKIVAVDALNSLSWISVEAWVDRGGGDVKSLRFIEMPLPQMGPALAAGRVDAALLADPILSQVVAAQGQVLAYNFDAIGKQFVLGAWFTTSDYAKAHPDVVKRFAAVILRTARWANRHQGESRAILERYTKVSMVEGVHRTLYPERMQPAEMQPLIDAAARYGVLKSAFPVDQMFLSL